jgi:predicted Zn-dependent peptidase
MRFIVFVNSAYYPYVDDPVEAESVEEARAKVAERLRPGDDTEVYLAPAKAVERVGPMEGPRRKPVGTLALIEEWNRQRSDDLTLALVGGFPISVEPGSLS